MSRSLASSRPPLCFSQLHALHRTIAASRRHDNMSIEPSLETNKCLEYTTQIITGKDSLAAGPLQPERRCRLSDEIPCHAIDLLQEATIRLGQDLIVVRLKRQPTLLRRTYLRIAEPGLFVGDKSLFQLAVAFRRVEGQHMSRTYIRMHFALCYTYLERRHLPVTEHGRSCPRRETRTRQHLPSRRL